MIKTNIDLHHLPIRPVLLTLLGQCRRVFSPMMIFCPNRTVRWSVVATSLAQHLIRPPAPLSVLEQFHPTNAPISRPPPPRYEPSAVNADPSPSPVIQAQGGFDREFSRLLYGKEARRNRHQRQKRKAFSDPVK